MIRNFISGVLLVFLVCSCTSQPKLQKIEGETSAQGVSRTKYDTSDLARTYIKYDVPTSWQEEEVSQQMRIAQFKVADNTTFAVYYFPAMPGSIESNLLRWRKQFVDNDKRRQLKLKQFNQDGLAITVFYMIGDYQKSLNPFKPDAEKVTQEDYAVYVITVETADAKWFFKTIGPEAEVAEAAADLTKFTKSIRQYID
jgi:hypothetical protein